MRLRTLAAWGLVLLTAWVFLQFIVVGLAGTGYK